MYPFFLVFAFKHSRKTTINTKAENKKTIKNDDNNSINGVDDGNDDGTGATRKSQTQ